MKPVGMKLLRVADVERGILKGLWLMIRMHQARVAKTISLSVGKRTCGKV
jgi:hypothetical protein